MPSKLRSSGGLFEKAGGDGGDFLVLVENANGGFWVVFEEGLGVVGEAGGGGEGVGEFCLGENDGGGAAGGEAEAGFWVDEVGVFLAVGGDVLEEVAGG